MSRISRIARIGIAGAGVCALALGLVSPAFADYAPSSNDVVGVGTADGQNIMDFVADGDNAFDLGYNDIGASKKLVSFDGTPDANGRAGYLNNSTYATLKPLYPTITLRAGMSPVQRPAYGGPDSDELQDVGGPAGMSSLLNDTGAPEQINYVRMSRAPTALEEQEMVIQQHTELHTIQIATDPLEMAYASAASNMPAAGLSVAQLADIYNCVYTKWNQVGGTSANTIVPLMPYVGSETRSTFLTDIFGYPNASPGLCVHGVEDNDPTAITGNADPADAIEPFSAGRLALYGNSYFKDPSVVFPGATGFLAAGIRLQQGFATDGVTHRLASDGREVYDDVRPLFIVMRDRDVTSTTPWQVGSSLNWAKTLFIGTGSYVAKSFNAALISAAGATPHYLDEGAGFVG